MGQATLPTANKWAPIGNQSGDEFKRLGTDRVAKFFTRPAHLESRARSETALVPIIGPTRIAIGASKPELYQLARKNRIPIEQAFIYFITPEAPSINVDEVPDV